MKLETWHWAAIAAALGVVFLWTRHDGTTGGFNRPQFQPQPDNDIARLTDSGTQHCHPEQHHAGYVYTKHRFPRTVGGEITALIHRGYSTMRVPASADVQWLIAPPSEAMF